MAFRVDVVEGQSPRIFSELGSGYPTLGSARAAAREAASSGWPRSHGRCGARRDLAQPGERVRILDLDTSEEVNY